MTGVEAIALVGGLGTRLRSMVPDVPKPLAPVGGRPFLAWVLDRLQASGVARTILATGHLAHMVEDAIGRDWKGMRIDYSVEDEPLGTGGAVAKALTLLEGREVHVLNGDTFLDYSLDALADRARSADALAGVALARVPDTARYGAMQLDGEMVRGFSEKGRTGPGMINAGCYFLTEAALTRIPSGERFSFENDVLPDWVASGRVLGYADTDGFIDIGIAEDFIRAQSIFGGRFA
jgi:D-glycero-alpha-D-manno-heptose 1-phosphate guanylyltransferase